MRYNQNRKERITIKNNSKKNTIILLILILLLAILCGLFITDKLSSNKKSTTNDPVSKNEYNENIKKQESRTPLYTYTSGDVNAANGNPEVLKVYEIDETKIDFNYHNASNKKDVTGTAKKVENNKYIYELEEYKIKLTIMDDTIEVKEYINNKLNSTIKLFK